MAKRHVASFHGLVCLVAGVEDLCTHPKALGYAILHPDVHHGIRVERIPPVVVAPGVGFAAEYALHPS